MTTQVTLTTIRTVRIGNDRLGRIKAEWSGGPYISLTFTRSMIGHIISHPKHHINVWDYERDEPSLPFVQINLRAALVNWIREQDDPDWFQKWLDA